MTVKFGGEEAIGELSADALQTIDGMERLYDAYRGIAYGLALQILREKTAAEDVLQEAFLAIWRARDQYESKKGSVKSWLLTIVRNRAIDRLRHDRAGSTKIVELDQAELIGDNADPGATGPERLWMHQALQALPTAQREAILLAFFGGYTYAQIAERKGLPLGTVKGQLRLGLQKLATLERQSASTVAR